MKIVVSGYYGSKNGGDEAMLAAMLEVLREEVQDLHVTVISLNPEYTRRRHHVDAVPRSDILPIIKKIRDADLLISGGGSLLQNVTSGRSLYYYLAIIFFALIFGRVMFSRDNSSSEPRSRTVIRSTRLTIKFMS